MIPAAPGAGSLPSSRVPRAGPRAPTFATADSCYIGPMSATKPETATVPIDPGLDDDVSDDEMDRLLAGRHDDIQAKLDQAREERERGESAPLEPLDVFLREARERLRMGR